MSTDEEQIFESHFTYHGFRYVEVTGLSKAPGLGLLTGRVFPSDATMTGDLECSSALLNRLMANITWTQRAKMMSVPTDCPQRGERAGWMGNIQVFTQTAAFNMDMAAFLSKWMRDARDGQADDGRFLIIRNPGAVTFGFSIIEEGECAIQARVRFIQSLPHQGTSGEVAAFIQVFQNKP